MGCAGRGIRYDEMKMTGRMIKYLAVIAVLAMAMPAGAQDVAKMAPMAVAPDMPLTIVKAIPGDGDAKGFYLVVIGDPGQFPMADYYPAKAMQYEQSGEAVISCTVGEGGVLVDCQIVSETPAGFDFGIETLHMVERCGRADPDVSKPGDIVRGKIIWVL